MTNKKLEPMNEDSENIYDEQINPLMAQIIKICKDNKIPLFASFQLTNEEAPLMCTTILPFEGQDSKHNEYIKIRQQRSEFAAFTIISGPKK